MKRVLWISRHTMTPDQLADLERIMGGPVKLEQLPQTVEDPEVLRSPLEHCDAVAAVLPLELMASLVHMAGTKPVLFSVSGRKATGKTVPNAAGIPEPEFAFVHLCWRQVVRLDLETRTL